MAITINGDTGVSGVDGTVSNPALEGSDPNTGLYFPAADTVAIGTNGSERMRVDSSGNVGIGTSSPIDKLTVNGSISTNSSQSYIYSNGGSGTSVNSGFFLDGSGSTLRMFTGNSERMRIDSSGNVGIGTSSPGAQLQLTKSGTSDYTTFRLTNSGASGRTYEIGLGGNAAAAGYANNLYFYDSTASALRMVLDSSGNLLVGGTSSLTSGTTFQVYSPTATFAYRNTNTTAGKWWYGGPNSSNNFFIYNQSSVGVYIVDGGTSWNSSSDERVKDIIEPITDAANKVSSLRAVIGKYKTDKEGTRRSFLIAQDIQSVLPEAVDATDPNNLGVAYTDVIPLLVAAITELKAELDALKAKVGA